MNKRYIFEVNIKVEQSNFCIEDSTINDWRFFWTNDNVCAIISATKLFSGNGQMTDGFEYLNTPDKLGLLIDCISFITDLPVSCKVDFRLFRVDDNNKINILDLTTPFTKLLQQARSNKLLQHGSSVDEWPIRVSPGISHNFRSKDISFIRHLFVLISKIRIKNTSIKLLNYWRKGFDLDVLNYWDESFLVFFKILEYFDKRYQPNNNLYIDNKIMKAKSEISKKALRIAGGAESTKPSKYLIKLISDFIEIRNNSDIAHMRIKPLPKDRNGAFYFTSYLNIWDTHDDIKELARLFVYKQLGIKGLQLRNDGGLFKLTTI
ncbi:MAG: hypothetical protein QY322_00490 [bacterium]|nr:MAG: hypothetical protein QY322_00490 [bacterium]